MPATDIVLPPLLLPSFVRRCDHTQQLKEHIRISGAKLSRKGRSRNWQLTITPTQLNDLLSTLREAQQPSWQWLLKRLEDHRPQLSADDLLDLVRQSPNLSVSELMGHTDCTLAEARKAIDTVEEEHF